MTEVEYVICPLCGSSHVFRSWARHRRRTEAGLPNSIWRWVDYPLESMRFIQIRDLGGKVSGVRSGHRGSAPGVVGIVGARTLSEAAGDPRYEEMMAEMRNRLITIARELYRLGIIGRDEILSILE